MKLEIPKKNSGVVKGEQLYNHQARLTKEKTERFARVREILGGYNTSELLEILIDQAIEAYDDGQKPHPDMMPRTAKNND